MSVSEESRAGDDVGSFAFLAALDDEARALVEDSLQPRHLGFGDVVYAAGDPADALYLLTAGTVRSVGIGPHGEEVSVATFKPGDWFGAAELLDDTPRATTTRMSDAGLVRRLDGSLFHALIHAHPDIRAVFEALARRRALANFFRTHSAFTQLTDSALDRLVAKVSAVEVAAGEVVVREGDAAEALFIVESGRLKAYRDEGGEAEDIEFLRAGDFFGDRPLADHAPHASSVAAVVDAVLLSLPAEDFRDLVQSEPSFAERVEKRRSRHDFRHLARVPLDFAQEILPAAAAHRAVVPEQAQPLHDAATELRDATELAPGTPTAPGREKHRRTRRFPHLYQLDAADCGAACLAMVCRHFGRKVAISHIRDVVHTSTEGTSLAGITRGAHDLGLAAHAVRASKSHLSELALPAIVHWQGNHWVVLYDVDDERVRVADPAIGLRRMPRAEFLEQWSGYAAVVEKTPAFETAPEGRSSLAWLAPFFRPHRRALLVAVLLAFLAAALQLALPILTQVVVDRVLPHHDIGLLWIVVGALAAVLATIGGATLLQRYLIARVAVRVDSDTLDFLTGKLLMLPMRYFHTRRTGDIERRLAGLRQIRQFVVGSGIQAITASTQLIAALVLMLFYSWQLALVFLATVPLYAGLLRYSSRRLRPMYESLEEAYGKYASAQIDAIKGMETVKALAAEKALRQLMLDQFQSLVRRLFRTQFLVMAYQGGVQMLGFTSFGLFLVVGALEVVHGSMSVGAFVAFNSLVALANAPVLLLLGLWDSLQQSRVLIARLDDVLTQEPEQASAARELRPVTTLAGQLELRGVSFRYGGAEAPPILEDLSFAVEPGQTIAVVGRSGSGKTTLVKLLSGLIEPTDGSVLFDGVELRELDYGTLRRQVGFVLQESYLFDDTIARNIAFGEENPDRDQIAWAARAAAAHDFIQRLPLGYDTRVGESGLQLSGGQRQRIAIARALYHQPPVLLFDEATSALDTESERAVKESMDQLLAGRTSFVIAHRLSTIRDADRILVLDGGRLVEDGSHRELMARQGLYYYLASQQLET